MKSCPKKFPQGAKTLVQLFVLLPCLLGFSANGWAFGCWASGKFYEYTAGNATVDIYVDVVPSTAGGKVLVVDLGQSITCINQLPDYRLDYVSLTSGSAYGGALNNYKGYLEYFGERYDFPLNSPTRTRAFVGRANATQRWDVKLYLTPISVAGGVTLQAGAYFATFVLKQLGTESDGTGVENLIFTWRLHTKKQVVVPTGGCEVNSRNVNVMLPDYPGDSAIPLSVKCGMRQKLSYYLSGTTVDSQRTVFKNVASKNAAQGIGIQIADSSGAIPTNRTVSLGPVAGAYKSLGLKASYMKTGGQGSAGNVQAVVGVTFVYE